MHFHSFAAFHSKPSLMCPYGHGISSEGVRVLSFHRYHLKVFSICKYIKLKWSQTRTCFPHIAHPFKILSLIMFLRNICAFSEIPAKNKHYIVELNAAHFKFTIIYWNGNKLKHWNELRHNVLWFAHHPCCVQQWLIVDKSYDSRRHTL